MQLSRPTREDLLIFNKKTGPLMKVDSCWLETNLLDEGPHQDHTRTSTKKTVQIKKVSQIKDFRYAMCPSSVIVEDLQKNRHGLRAASSLVAS